MYLELKFNSQKQKFSDLSILYRQARYNAAFESKTLDFTRESMTQDEMKQAVAEAAMAYIRPKLDTNSIVGVGTGSTANFFIDALAKEKHFFDGAIASSETTAERLRSHGIPVYDLNNIDRMDVYIDGADESNHNLHLIKGGGAALTREKIVAAVATEFVCIADESKLVDILGDFPLPVEVIPMARSHVARKLASIGGNPVWREGVITDNGNLILDVHNLSIVDPRRLEDQINAIVGVVCNGLFANRAADVLLLGTKQGVKTLKATNRT